MRYRLECPANRYVFKSHLNYSELTAGSLKPSGSEFQTVGPATEKARVPGCRVELVELTVDNVANSGWLHCLDQSFAETITESKIWTEIKDQRKVKSSVWTEQSRSPKFGLSDRSAETKLWTWRSSRPKLIQALRISSYWFYMEETC